MRVQKKEVVVPQVQAQAGVLIRQVPIVNMQTVPKQTEKMVPQIVEEKVVLAPQGQLQEFEEEAAVKWEKEVVVLLPQVKVAELHRHVTVPKQILKMVPQFSSKCSWRRLPLSCRRRGI